MTPYEVLQKAIDESGCSSRKEWYNFVYLKSDHWRILRDGAVKRSGFSCERCQKKASLQVHHLRYKEIFNVTLDDLQVLCEKCHKIWHGLVVETAPAKPQPKPQVQNSKVRLTRELLQSACGTSGGWNAKQLYALGVNWPPKSGWLAKLIGTDISQDKWNRFVQLKDAKKGKKKKKKHRNKNVQLPPPSVKSLYQL